MESNTSSTTAKASIVTNVGHNAPRRRRRNGTANASAASGMSTHRPPTEGSVNDHAGNGVGDISRKGNVPVGRNGRNR